MKLIRITTNYLTYLKKMYSKQYILSDKPYQLQYEMLMFDCFGWADFWTYALEKTGYEVWEPVANAEIMQKAWAKENGFKYSSKRWITEIVRYQIISFKPDILFVDDYETFNKEFLSCIRSECPSIRLIVGWCGAPYNSDSVFSAYDILLSNIPELVAEFINNGLNSHYFKHAFEPRILDRIDKSIENRLISCSFIGSIFAGKLAHNQRIDLIESLAKDMSIEIFSDVSSFSKKSILKIFAKKLSYQTLQPLFKFNLANKVLSKFVNFKPYTFFNTQDLISRTSSPIIKKARLPVFGIEMYQTLFDSQITLNNHIDISRNSASNMRLFEATGIGTCLLTDWKQNLHELFEPDYEVVTYRSVEECIEKAKWLLDNPVERDKIAKAGQARTLREHTFDHRALALDEIIQNSLRKK